MNVPAVEGVVRRRTGRPSARSLEEEGIYAELEHGIETEVSVEALARPGEAPEVPFTAAGTAASHQPCLRLQERHQEDPKRERRANREEGGTRDQRRRPRWGSVLGWRVEATSKTSTRRPRVDLRSLKRVERCGRRNDHKKTAAALHPLRVCGSSPHRFVARLRGGSIGLASASYVVLDRSRGINEFAVRAQQRPERH